MSTKKSTIGRSIKWGTRAVAVRSVHAVSPELAAGMVARWFLEPEDLGVPAAGSGTPFSIRAGGLQLAARSWGRGPLVLLVHGWNGRGDQLAALGSALAARGHRAVAFDLPGHGDSPGSELSIPLMVRSIETVVDLFGPVEAMIAHSFGAVGVTLALAGGIDVKRVGLIAPANEPGRWIAHITRALGLPGSSRPLVASAVESRVGVAIAGLDPIAAAPSIDAELLVIHDRDDREVPLAAGAAYAEAWPGASLRVTRGLGHTRILSAPPVIEALASFAAGRGIAEATRILGDADRSDAFETRDAHLGAVVDAVADAL